MIDYVEEIYFKIQHIDDEGMYWITDYEAIYNKDNAHSLLEIEKESHPERIYKLSKITEKRIE